MYPGNYDYSLCMFFGKKNKTLSEAHSAYILTLNPWSRTLFLAGQNYLLSTQTGLLLLMFHFSATRIKIEKCNFFFTVLISLSIISVFARQLFSRVATSACISCCSSGFWSYAGLYWLMIYLPLSRSTTGSMGYVLAASVHSSNPYLATWTVSGYCLYATDIVNLLV